MARFDPDAMLRVLADHGVQYALIGGLAATLHGSPLRTGDADICPSRRSENLTRLAAGLRTMDAKIRSPDAAAGLPFACDASFFHNVELVNLTEDRTHKGGIRPDLLLIALPRHPSLRNERRGKRRHLPEVAGGETTGRRSARSALAAPYGHG